VTGIAAVQPLLVGAVLVWSSYGKLFGRYAEERAKRSALKRLTGEERAHAAYKGVGGVELLVGLALLLPPVWVLDAVAASVLAAGFVGYLSYARVVAPGSSCGCLGSAELPVSGRSIGRAGLLLAASVLAGTTGTGWWSVLTPATMTVLVTEAVLFVALSGELDRHWLLPLRRFKVRLTHPLGDTARKERMPWATTQQQLIRSAAYRAVGEHLRSDVRENWDDGDWRFVSFTASYHGTPATAVFAVPLLRYEPDAVKVAIVDEESGATLYAPVLVPLAG
jgi:methylamine utilization protein MauE